MRIHIHVSACVSASNNKGKENIKVKEKVMCWECSYHLSC